MTLRSFVIGITGPSCSGKSLFSNILKSKLVNSILLLQDDHYLDRSKQIKDHNGKLNFDTPFSFDQNSFLNNIKKLKSGNDIEIAKYDYNRNTNFSSTVKIESNPLLILEGLFLYHTKDLESMFDLKIFLDVDPDIQLERRLKRDRLERAYDEADVLYKMNTHVKDAYQKWLIPQKLISDHVIENNDLDINAIEILLDDIIDSSIPKEFSSL